MNARGIIERTLRAVQLLGERDRLVRVKSWMPSWDGKHLCWPIMLVDSISYRATVAPVWDRVRIRNLLRGNR